MHSLGWAPHGKTTISEPIAFLCIILWIFVLWQLSCIVLWSSMLWQTFSCISMWSHVLWKTFFFYFSMWSSILWQPLRISLWSLVLWQPHALPCGALCSCNPHTLPCGAQYFSDPLSCRSWSLDICKILQLCIDHTIYWLTLHTLWFIHTYPMGSNNTILVQAILSPHPSNTLLILQLFYTSSNLLFPIQAILYFSTQLSLSFLFYYINLFKIIFFLFIKEPL